MTMMTNERSVAAFDPEVLLKTQQAAAAIASSPLLPEHLRGRRKGGTFTEYDHATKVANLLLVADAARVFQCNMLMLAKSSFVIGSSLDFDGRVYAALANTSGFLAEELDYEYRGEQMDRCVMVRGRLKSESQPREAELHITTALAAGGKDSSPEWKNNPDQMLAYAGARQWVRRHLSKVLLGFVSVQPEELEPANIEPQPERLPAEMPSEDYKNTILELNRCEFKHQVTRLVQQIGGRNKMTDAERNQAVAEARHRWVELPYSEDDPEQPEEKAGEEESIVH